MPKWGNSLWGWLERYLGAVSFWIFVVVCAYFLYALYFFVYGLNFSIGLISDYYVYDLVSENPWWWGILYYGSEGVMACVANFFRVIVGCFALYSSFLFWRKKELSFSLIKGKVSNALLFEAWYYFSLGLSVVASFVYFFSTENLYYFDHTPGLIFVLVAGIPLLPMIFIVSPFLLKLRSKIIGDGGSKEIIKWGCLSSISYLFVVFWFNYSMSWAGVLVPYMRSQQQYGMSFLLEPFNLVSFVVTIFGLFLIGIFGLLFTLPAIRKKSFKLKSKRIGFVILALGSYFLFNTLFYYLTGGYEAHPSVWYEMIGPLHNPNFWCLSFFFLGLSVLVHSDTSKT
jgi:hypothetical protein